MDEARYRIALKVAEAGFRRLGRVSIDGKEPHDIAMHGLHLEPWSPNVVRCDVLDAYRKERGRTARRRMVAIHDGYAAREKPQELGIELKLVGQVELVVCELLSAGYMKSDVALVVGISRASLSKILSRIRRRNAELIQGAGGSGGGTEEPAG